MHKIVPEIKPLPQLLLIAFLLLTNQLQAQTIGGMIQSATDSSIVEGAHIINVSNNEMAISSSKGLFELLAAVGDTLVISNIEFETKSFSIKSNTQLKVFLIPANIQLKEVVVSNMPKSEYDFKRKVLDMEMQPTQDFIVAGIDPVAPKSKVPPIYNLDQSNSLGFAIFHPLKFTARKLSKGYQDKAKYYKLKANQGQIIRVEQKFDRSLVKQITHLEEEELTAFIQFLDIDNNFILKSNEYEIALHIKNKYKLYQSLQETDSTTKSNSENG